MNKKKKHQKSAVELHENVPPDWYYQSIKKNMGQRFWHTTRFREVGKFIEKKGKKILDIGSADGVFTQVIAKKSGAETVIGIDVLRTSVDWANNKWKKDKRLRFKTGDAHKLQFKSSTFDAVFALEVLEHVHDPLKVMKEIRRVLKKGGYAVMLVPSDNLLFNAIWWVWTKGRGRIWNEAHIQSFKNSSLIKVAKKSGLEVETDRKFLLGMLHLVKVRKK